jgi:hypothetical protein
MLAGAGRRRPWAADKREVGSFATSMMATQDFGPFFGFTVSARTSARILGAAVERRSLRPQPTS